MKSYFTFIVDLNGIIIAQKLFQIYIGGRKSKKSVLVLQINIQHFPDICIFGITPRLGLSRHLQF